MSCLKLGGAVSGGTESVTRFIHDRSTTKIIQVFNCTFVPSLLYSNICSVGTVLDVGYQDWINYNPHLWGTHIQQGNRVLAQDTTRVLNDHHRGVMVIPWKEWTEKVQESSCVELTTQPKEERNPKQKKDRCMQRFRS